MRGLRLEGEREIGWVGCRLRVLPCWWCDASVCYLEREMRRIWRWFWGLLAYDAAGKRATAAAAAAAIRLAVCSVGPLPRDSCGAGAWHKVLLARAPSDRCVRTLTPWPASLPLQGD